MKKNTESLSRSAFSVRFSKRSGFLLLSTLFSILFLLSNGTGFAQSADRPMPIEISVLRTSPTELVLKAVAQVPAPQKLYSIRNNPDELPATQFSFDSATAKAASGKLEEVAKVQSYKDPLLDGAETFLTEGKVTWTQVFQLKPGELDRLRGEITYMLKNGDEILPFTQEISYSLKADAEMALNNAGSSSHSSSSSDASADGGASSSAKENGTEEGGAEKGTLAGIMLIAFLAGIGTVFTPCVFPLIPVTVGFFTKRSKTRKEGIRNSVWYSLSIILIYTIPTLLLTAAFGDSVLYKISSSTTANLLFFAVFIFFAVSFFGAFDIQLPSSWATAVDGKAGKGGFIGIFFMALTLVIVSFSCTGPIMSSLLTGTASQGVAYGTVGGMLAFSIGLALPFSLFAFFPSLLNAMPKAGGWLNSVKVVFGFLELALALKFLSNADLANHWGLLDREVFLVLWIVIFGLMGLYLLGKLKFSHDSPMPYLGVPRLFLAIATLSFTLYLVPGLWGAPLNFLSGLLPHTSTQDFNLHELKYDIQSLKASGAGVGGSSSTEGSGTSMAPAPKKYVNLFHMPFGLTAYYDLEEAKAASKITGKPIMIDFTGHSCANCRKMENQVWSKPEVLQKLRNDFVILSLYVDDKTELEPEEVYNSKIDGNPVKTIGDKNLDYEQTMFNEVAQPLYMFIDENGKPLSMIKYGYDPDEKKFIDHLQKMIEAHKNRAQ